MIRAFYTDLGLILCLFFALLVIGIFSNLLDFIVFGLSSISMFFNIFRGNNANVMIIPTHKLHSQVDSFSFNDETDVLIGTYVRCSHF